MTCGHLGANIGLELSSLFYHFNFHKCTNSVGFQGGSVVKNLLSLQETQETWFQSLGQEDPLEEGMATHFSFLASRIPWTKESDRLQSIGSQRLRHNCSS